ncbi:MAG: TonB-dependent receptor [Opitutae bacterium]|nr:TonB-dependent receptor [Opitutae bacterium]
MLAFLGRANGQFADDQNSSSGLSPFEKAELRRLLDLDLRDLSRTPIRGVLGYDQEHWRNPASVHVIRPDDISLNGHVLTVDSFRNVAGMYVTRGVGYDDFVTMRNFSGSATEKFLTMVDGREVLQLMGGTINWTTEDVPLQILDRVEIIRGPGASIWGTNAVSGVVNVVTKHAAQTQGNSVRLILEDDGTFLGEYVHGGQVSPDSFYRVWVRDQEYSEGELMSGLPARDDGYARKAGFRFDKELAMDLDLTIAGGFATRRVEHVLDLTYRLFELLPLNLTGSNKVNTAPSWVPTWAPYATGTTLPWSTLKDAPAQGLTLDRYQNYEEMPQDASHVRAKLSGITDGDLEWSLAGYAELYDTDLGHIGHSWEREEFDLDFKANKPIGDRNHIAFGFSVRHMSVDVDERVTAPWDFPLLVPSPVPAPPILEYGSSPKEFDRITAFFQNSYDLTDRSVLSFGSKFEDSDLTGSSTQPGARFSFQVDEQNILWGAYSKAFRQPSLVEQFTEVSYARVFLAPGIAFPLTSSPTTGLGTEEMDAFELGWRTRPSDRLLIELSLYHYDTQNAVFSGPPIYSTSDVKTTGGELTFDYRASLLWHLQGGYSFSRGKKDGVEQKDFPESMANLSSHLKVRDDVIFTQSLYYTGERTIPSAYNPIPLDDYLRLDLGLVWRPDESLEIGLFGRDLLDSDHAENMYNDLDVEPGKVERTFLISITKKF